MSATASDYNQMYGEIQSVECAAAKCACVACNSCTCACSCRAVPEGAGDLEW